MVRSRKSTGDVLQLDGLNGCSVEVVAVESEWIEGGKPDGIDCVVRVKGTASMTMLEFFDSLGSIPIPPYFNRDAVPDDEVRYQNVFAKAEGSVAAPTAGLHFTDDLIEELGASASFLTLHVGAGTFKPIEAEIVTDHSMHSEKFSCNKREVEGVIAAIEQGKDVLAVGTTSARTLESLYWLGVSISEGEQRGGGEGGLSLSQYQAYDLPGSMPVAEALQLVVDEFPSSELISGKTSLMIVPGYSFKVVDKLVTNFHAPDSTLMLMVSAFAGTREIKEIYEQAIAGRMKFLSYGDAMMLERKREGGREKGE
jgi:S-adenosylmethionine:tRNA ribosyltransferase-isomerase